MVNMIVSISSLDEILLAILLIFDHVRVVVTKSLYMIGVYDNDSVTTNIDIRSLIVC